MKIKSVLASTLALTLAAASANAMPFGNVLHLHPRAAQRDGRISLTVYNEGISFKEITVEGKTYTLLPHHNAEILAPVGTVVYAGYGIAKHKKGSPLLQLTSQADGSRLKLV